MKRLLSCILLLAVPFLLTLGMTGQASARSGFIWIPHGGHVGGFRGGYAGPRMGMPAARFGGFRGYAGPRFAPGYGGYRYGAFRGRAVAPRFSPAYAGARYGAYGRYAGYPRYPRYANRGWYGRYPYGGYYAGRYWRRHNGYWGWGYPWGIGLGVAGLGLWDWGNGWGYPGYYDSGYYGSGYYDSGYYDNGYYTPVPAAGVGLHCQTPVRTCLLINPSDVGNGCSCRVPGGRARGVVIP